MKRVLLSLCLLSIDILLVGISIVPGAPNVPGTIDINFGVAGKVDLPPLLASLPNSHIFLGAIPTAMLSVANGSQYIAWNVPNSFSFITRLTTENILDTSYGTGGISSSSNYGVSSMVQDGSGRLLLLGDFTDDAVGWVSRYVAGDAGGLDTAFNHGTSIFTYTAKYTSMIQQTCARYVVAGQDHETGYITLWAFNEDGIADATFNSNDTPGLLQFPIEGTIYGLLADEYDRLYFSVRNHLSGIVSVFRTSSSGQIDNDFSDSSAILNGVDSDNHIRMAFDSVGNVVVVAHTLLIIDPAENPSPFISIAALNPSGTIEYSQLNLSFNDNPVLTHLVPTSDGKVLVAGYIMEDNDMWIARVQHNDAGAYELDATFSPDGITPGILLFDFNESASSRFLSAISMYRDGSIAIIGNEDMNSFLLHVYDQPDITSVPLCQNSKLIGTNDFTFGVVTPPVNAIGLFAGPRTGMIFSTEQRAQAIALQDDDTIVIAGNGQSVENGPMQIFMNVLTIDGLPDINFNAHETPGRAVILDEFNNQYVSDMLTFTTTDGIHKAILVGYVRNNILNLSNSLLLQYVLGSIDHATQAGLDQYFGGRDGDPLGVTVGDWSSQAFTVSRQSIGRIIVGGYNPTSAIGLLQAYTSDGLLDNNFGVNGSVHQGTTGIFVTVIDHLDRVLVAYDDGAHNLVLARILADGSGLDQTFGSAGTYFIDYDNMLSFSSSFRIALDRAGNIFVVSILANGTLIVVNKLDQNASTDIVASSTFDSRYFDGSLINFVLAKLLIDVDGSLIIFGSDQGDPIIIQVTASDHGFLRLDHEFNPLQTPGYLKYTPDIEQSTPKIFIVSALNHPDGRHILIGHKPNIA